MSDVDSVAALLIEHSRRNIEGCRCGWADLGKSHAKHVAQVLDETGLLVTSEEADFIAYGVERGWLSEDRAECEDEVDLGHCHYDLHMSLEEFRRVKVRDGVYERRDVRPRRYVTKWEPVEP